MLHVIPNVECEIVPRAIVGISLVATIEHVVLGDEVGGHWVEPHAQEGTNDEIVERLKPKEVPDQYIKGDLYDRVEYLETSGRLRTNHERAEGIEQWLQKQPDNLERNVVKEPSLPVSRKIYVIAVGTLISVVLHVVFFERDRHWYANG